jgi:uncharacterized protein YxeA
VKAEFPLISVVQYGTCSRIAFQYCVAFALRSISAFGEIRSSFLPKMPIMPMEGVVMSSKYLFLLLMFAVSVGCSMLVRRPPNIEAASPYLQSQSQRTQIQLEEMRAFHDKESTKNLEDIHIFRNHEMERLANTGKELEKEKLWQDDYEKTLERREKWTSWFKKKNKETKSDTPVASGTNKTVR